MNDKLNNTRFHLFRLDSEQPLVKLHDGKKLFAVSHDEILSYTKLRSAVFRETGRLWPARCADWNALLQDAKQNAQTHLLADLIRRVKPEWQQDNFGDEDFDGLHVPLDDDWHFEGELSYPNQCRMIFGIEPDLNELRRDLEAQSMSTYGNSSVLQLLFVEWDADLRGPIIEDTWKMVHGH